MSQRVKRSLFVTIILMAAIAIAATFFVKANLQASTTPVITVQTESSENCGGRFGGGDCGGQNNTCTTTCGVTTCTASE